MFLDADQLPDRIDHGNPDDILAEAQRMYRLLASHDGGFIGYVEEYGCMGMSEQNYRACGDAF